MGHATFDFDRWLTSLDTHVQGLPLAAALNAIAIAAASEAGATMWFAQILGHRWSYIAGEVRNAPSETPMVRMCLEGDIGLVSNGWGALSEPQRQKFVAFTKHLISDRQAQDDL